MPVGHRQSGFGLGELVGRCTAVAFCRLDLVGQSAPLLLEQIGGFGQLPPLYHRLVEPLHDFGFLGFGTVDTFRP